MGLVRMGPDEFSLTESKRALQKASDMMAVRLAPLEAAKKLARMALS